jgi:hypothetical protein
MPQLIPFYASILMSKAISVELFTALGLNIYIPLLSVLTVSCIYIVIQFLNNRDIDKVILMKKCILRLSIAYLLLALFTIWPFNIYFFSYTTYFLSLISDWSDYILLFVIAISEIDIHTGPLYTNGNDNHITSVDSVDWGWISFDGGHAVGGGDGEDDDRPGRSRSRSRTRPNPSAGNAGNAGDISNPSAGNAGNTANAANAGDIPIVKPDRQVRISITQKWHRYVSDKQQRGDNSSTTYRELCRNSGLTNDELRIMRQYISRKISSNSNVVHGRNTNFQSKVRRFIDDE